MTTRRSIALLAAVAVVALGLTACDPAPANEVPDGVRISVYQPRPDVPKNRIAIEVHNDGDAAVTITGARLRSSYFAESFDWEPDRTATVLPGYAVDLRVEIPRTAICDDAPAEHSVVFDWRRGDEAGAGTVAPEDPFEVLDLLHDAACLVAGVDEVVRLTAETLTAPDAMPAPADLLIAVDPTGAEGTVVIDAVRSTTLLNPAGADGVGVGELRLGIELGAHGPNEVRIPIVPNRCDAHALAEDKIGTRIPLYVTAPDGTAGRLVLDAGDGLRAQMYAFYTAFCGL